jgi:hypothetical protein
MRAAMLNTVDGCKAILALTASVFLLAAPSGAADLATVHLPGGIATDAEVGLAVSAPDTLYAAYWVTGEQNRPWQLLIYKFSSATGKVLVQVELDKAEPLRSRDGDVIQSAVDLSISPDGSMLLCSTLERGPVRKAWTLSVRDLHVLSSRTVSSGAKLLGFTHTGDVRLLRTQRGGEFEQEVNSATVLDLNARSLDKNVSERVVKLQEPAWRLLTAGTGDLLWTLDERASPQGEERITAYNVKDGKPVATREVSLADAQVGEPAERHPGGNDLQPPTTVPQPGIPPHKPQLTQIMAGRQSVFGVIHQPATQPAAWSRVVWIGASSSQTAMSSVLTGCDLELETIGRSGRMMVGRCDSMGHVLFDRYAIKSSEAVFLSTRTGSVVAVIPLKTRRPPLSLALDDSVQPAIAAVYDRYASVRLISVPQHGAEH